jgi:hypothetical protein
MANVPPFVDGPVVTEGWRGNGNQLYKAYMQAFIAAYENPDARIPQAMLTNLPPAAIVNNVGGLNVANLPRSIAFSFMGPAKGYPLQMAANIAVCAIYDAFWHPPGNQASYWGGLTIMLVGGNRNRFTQVSLCASSHKPGGHTSRAQVKALQAAYRLVSLFAFRVTFFPVVLKSQGIKLMHVEFAN